MAKLKTLKALAKKSPDCYCTFHEIKIKMPQADALKLLHNGFMDCSYSHDECPSFYIADRWADDEVVLMVLDEPILGLDKPYAVTNDLYTYTFDKIDDAINYYKTGSL